MLVSGDTAIRGEVLKRCGMAKEKESALAVEHQGATKKFLLKLDSDYYAPKMGDCQAFGGGK